MDTYNIRVEMTNDAFADDAGEYDPASQAVEVARILRKLADQLTADYDIPSNATILDVNGNDVGAAWLSR